jgi:hypothetical protein
MAPALTHSTLVPVKEAPPSGVMSSGYQQPVKVLVLAPFQYQYGSKSYWVTVGEWYSLDPVKDREEILYLDSPSNPYRQFMYVEGKIGTSEEKGDAYQYGTSYGVREIMTGPPKVEGNMLAPAEDPPENPHILEALNRAGVRPPLVTAPLVEPEETISLPISDYLEELPLYGEPVPVEVMEYVPAPGIEPNGLMSTNEEIVLSPLDMKKAELEAMTAGQVKTLANSLGIKYTDKKSVIEKILELPI